MGTAKRKRRNAEGENRRGKIYKNVTAGKESTQLLSEHVHLGGRLGKQGGGAGLFDGRVSIYRNKQQYQHRHQHQQHKHGTAQQQWYAVRRKDLRWGFYSAPPRLRPPPPAGRGPERYHDQIISDDVPRVSIGFMYQLGFKVSVEVGPGGG